MVIKLEERLCTYCGAKVLQIVDVIHHTQLNELGRSESIEVTCTDYREDKTLSKELISELMRIFFLEKIKRICLHKTKYIWYSGYEIDLWESLNGNNRLALDAEDILAIDNLSKNLNLWVVNPVDWNGLENNALPFIPLRSWRKLYTQRNEKFKKVSNELHHDPRGTSETSES